MVIPTLPLRERVRNLIQFLMGILRLETNTLFLRSLALVADRPFPKSMRSSVGNSVSGSRSEVMRGGGSKMQV